MSAEAAAPDLREEARALGLTDSEYDLIGEKIGRGRTGWSWPSSR